MTDIVVQQGDTVVKVGTPINVVVKSTQSGTVVVQRDENNLNAVVPVQPIALKVGADTPGPKVIEVGTPGPAGPPGPSGSEAVQRVAGADLGGHRLVRTLADGSVDYVDNTNVLHGDDTLGVTTGAALTGAPATIQTSGALTEPSWSWTPGEPIFAGTNGQLTQTPPVAAFSQVVGFAATPTSMVVAIQPSIYTD